jgi:transposase
MPAPNSKKKVLKYTDREKLTAVRLSEAPGVKVKDVAAALDIHPFMLSRWRKAAREGLLGGAPLQVKKRKGGRDPKPRPRVPSTAQMTKYAQLKKQHDQLRKEHEFLKKFDRFRAQMKAKGSRSSRGSGGNSE